MFSRRFLIGILTLLFSLPISFALSVVVTSEVGDNSDSNILILEYSFTEQTPTDATKFSLRGFYNEEDLGEVCVRAIEDTTSFTCGVRNKGEGVYTFSASLLDSNGEVLETKYTQYALTNDSILETSFTLGQELHASIEVLQGENIIITQFIPKSVIAELTLENKDRLLTSSKDYVIVEADPLIAWHVEKAPEKINYTIKKRVSPDELSKFKTSLEEESDSFTYLKTIIIMLILLIIALSIYQGLRKK